MNEGLGLVRLMMVLSSLAPLFLLWAVRGISSVADRYLVPLCLAFAVVPTLVLLARIRICIRSNDAVTITIGTYEDHRDHLLVYLVAMLVPLYQADLKTTRDTLANLVALLLIIFLFFHLRLHYMNVLFALRGYRVYTVTPPESVNPASRREPFVLLTSRPYLAKSDSIRALRLSNTVFMEQRSDHA